MATTDVPDPASHTVAWFRSSQEVRAAESALERAGIESRYIQVAHPDPATNRRDIDRRTWGSLGIRAAVGVVVGAVVGALVGLLVGLALGNSGMELFAFVFGGVIFGGAPGAFYMVGSRLPTQEEAFDTYGDEDGREWIAVGGPDEVRRDAAGVLSGQNPVRMDGAAA